MELELACSSLRDEIHHRDCDCRARALRQWQNKTLETRRYLSTHNKFTFVIEVFRVTAMTGMQLQISPMASSRVLYGESRLVI